MISFEFLLPIPSVLVSNERKDGTDPGSNGSRHVTSNSLDCNYPLSLRQEPSRRRRVRQPNQHTNSNSVSHTSKEDVDDLVSTFRESVPFDSRWKGTDPPGSDDCAGVERDAVGGDTTYDLSESILYVKSSDPLRLPHPNEISVTLIEGARGTNLFVSLVECGDESDQDGSNTRLESTQ